MLRTMNNAFAPADTLHLSNLTKVFWPEHGYTKRDLIDYYREIAPVILPTS
jgi:DNA primase